jgi:hypothetical protein
MFFLLSNLIKLKSNVFFSSLIFASGTLAPLATYSGELKIPFDIQLGKQKNPSINKLFN